MPIQFSFLHHRGHFIPQDAVLSSVQKLSPSPVSAPLVHDLARRLADRYFTDDVVYVNLHNKWYHGVISKVLLRTDRNLSTGDAFRIDHTPHRVGVDLGIPLDIANRRDSPAWYLYRVTLSNPNIFPDLDLVSSDRLSRDLGFLAIAIMTKLPRPRRRYPAGRRVPPRLSVGSQAITPMPGVPIAQVNFAFGNPSNINAGGGTFVSGNGPGTTQNNSGGTFNDVSRDLLWETPGYQA
ncbi:hypothetical protein HGRIS_000065 [Hohenbuehelia grisea]|uniref:Uncharacterized protein n=1 Tax=Hohenbuehelia grisea TaxID=104357 RepID=A0ABR3JS26_9AGAR